MSTLMSSLKRLFAGVFAQTETAIDPDSMRLNDWADLPSHHPVCR